jgi:hypothetical protein
MPTLQQVRTALPPFRNKKELINQWQGTNDIIYEIMNTHKLYEADYDRIASLFDTGNVYDTSNEIWNFLKYNLTYNEESGEEQSVKSPSAILHPGENIDCKHYSLFAAGILDAIKRKYDDNYTWYYRFASDKKGAKEATHVFVVVNDAGKEIWIDPCLSMFDYHKNWSYYIDKQPMSLVKISGNSPQPVNVTVNKDVAWSSFLTCVSNNFFGLKDLMQSNQAITSTQLKQYCISNNFDYNTLLNMINS